MQEGAIVTALAVTDFIHKNRAHLIAVLAFVAVLFIAFQNVIFTSGFIEYADFTTPIQAQRYIGAYFYSWNPFGSYSTFELLPRIMLYSVPFATVCIFGLSMAVLQKFLVLFPIFLAFIAMYALGLHLTKKEDSLGKSAACFIVAVIFALNPWIVSETRHFTLIWGYALAPLVFLFFSKYLESNSRKHLLVASLLLSISAITPLWIIETFGLLILWTIFTSAIVFRTESLRAAIACFARLAKVIAVFALFSAFWILPMLAISSVNALAPSYVHTQEALAMLSRNSELVNSARLIGDWWPQTPWQPESCADIWNITSFVLPVLALAGFVSRWRSKYTIFFAAVAAVSLFLSLGTAGGDFYSWLAFDSPIAGLGWTIRNSARWESLLAFAYSVLILHALTGFTALFRNVSGKKITSIVIFAVVIGAFVFYAWPTIDGYSNTILNPVEIPDDYLGVNARINQSAMWFYPLEGSSLTWSGASPNFHSLSASTENVGMFQQPVRHLMSFLYGRLSKSTVLFAKAIDVLGAKYVLFHRDVTAQPSVIAKALDRLEKQQGLDYVDAIGTISIFENGGYSDRFFIPNKTVSIVGGLEALDALASTDIEFTETAVEFIDQTGSEPHGTLLSFDDAEYAPLEQLQVIAPYKYVTHHAPARMWSKSGTSDPLHGPWHSYLEQRGIDNWDFDYGKGLAITSAPSVVDEKARDARVVTGLEIFLRNTTVSDKMSAAVVEKPGTQEISVTLSEGTGAGWKIFATSAFEITPNTYYRSAIKLSAVSVTKLHGKLVLYGADGKEIGNERIIPETSGNASLTFEKTLLIPTNAVSAKIQAWARESEEQSQFNVSGFALYDLSNFTKPNEIVMPAKCGSCEIRIRYFESSKGGSMEVLAGSSEFTVNSLGERNRFVWQSLGIVENVDMIKLQNIAGFNAVNVFTLAEKEAHPERNEIIQVLVLEPGKSKAFHVTKSGDYGITIASASNFDTSAQIDGRAVSQNIYLSEGSHVIEFTVASEISNPSVVYAWIYPADYENLTDALSSGTAGVAEQSLKYMRIDPTRYEISVNATAPFMLVFAEAYDSLWLASVKSGSSEETVQSTPLYAAINGFWINQTGPLRIVVEYAPQKWFYVGLVITAASLIFAVVFAMRKKVYKVRTIDKEYRYSYTAR